MKYHDPKKFLQYELIMLWRTNNRWHNFKSFLYYGLYGNFHYYWFKLFGKRFPY